MQPYPATGARWQVSKDGGQWPRWRGDGKEIFWLDPHGTLMAAEVATGQAFQAGLARSLFETGITTFSERFAVSRDGKRFLLPLPVEQQGTSALTVVQNWLGAAKR
ncbi:MAG: hypothetical protein R2762_04675 [Bryobacteraceae bacterium]